MSVNCHYGSLFTIINTTPFIILRIISELQFSKLYIYFTCVVNFNIERVRRS